MKSSETKSRKKSNSSRNRSKPKTKTFARLLDDENTTNSEASEHGVFSDINWEENLEVDTTSLLDEFAPQAISRPSTSTTSPAAVSIKPDEEEKNVLEEKKANEEEEHLLNDLVAPSEFHINLKLLIHNYKTNKWVEGVVEEIDMEEEEILIRYDGGTDSPEEWLSMSSQRIKKKTSISNISKVPPNDLEPKRNETKESISSSIKQPVTSIEVPDSHHHNVLNNFPLKPLPPIQANKTKQPTTKKISKIKRSFKKPFKKSFTFSKKVNKRNKLKQAKGKVSRRLPIWKANAAAALGALGPSTSSPILGCKFSEGEKVLAKWSDHRMQKFPAVIRRVCGGSLYDVLFYDGFEKTITEDNIYKTTEEEMAKYNECKPSEADSFIDMDITSKHERRQKKRKTFDDFFEEKDLKRKKKIDAYDLNRSESFLRASLSRNKPALQSFSVHGRKTLGSAKPPPVTPPSKIVSSSSAQNSPQESLATPIPSLNPIKDLISKQPTPPLPINKSKSENIHGNENIPPRQAKSNEIAPLDLPVKVTQHPLEITCHDGIIRKSILIDDNKLPPGWTKHVIAWVDNVWACFLFTPDRYAVHSLIELRKYFRMSQGQEPPEGLDFSYPKESLQDLVEAQKNIVAQPGYRKWVNKVLDERKVMKKVRILPPSRSVGPGGHFGTKRIRTLLPRYRSHPFNQGSSVKTTEGKVWRCPKSGCEKKFRKENLLHMHIKHYHIELSELAENAPNVVDLALARTSASGVFTADTTIKRVPAKSPVSDRIPDKIPDVNPTVPEHNLLSNDIKSTNPIISPITTSETTSPIVSNSLKVLTPVKQLTETVEKKENEISFSEKPRPQGIHRLNVKKYGDSKLNDDTFITGTRIIKRQPQIMEKNLSGDSNDGTSDEAHFKDDSMIIERLQSEEIINCICGFREEDGLMVQCEVCLCWQHGACHGMEKDEDVPERYVCTICLDPIHVRSSQRYSYANHYLTLTKLPRFNYRTCKESVLRHRERILSKSFELTSNLQSIHKMERALTAKINISQQKDHPKLYLWSTNWDSPKRKLPIPNPKKINSEKGRRDPIGEEPIESIDCRLRLLDRIEADQQDMESRLTIIQAQLQALESEDFDLGGEERESNGGDPLLKQAVYMLLRDLSTLATATSLS